MAWVSEMNIEGAARGIEQNKGRAVKAYGDMTAEMLDEVESGMGKVNTALADGIGEMETGFSARATIEQVSAAVPSMADRRRGSETALRRDDDGNEHVPYRRARRPRGGGR